MSESIPSVTLTVYTQRVLVVPEYDRIIAQTSYGSVCYSTFHMFARNRVGRFSKMSFFRQQKHTLSLKSRCAVEKKASLCFRTAFEVRFVMCRVAADFPRGLFPSDSVDISSTFAQHALLECGIECPFSLQASNVNRWDPRIRSITSTRDMKQLPTVVCTG